MAACSKCGKQVGCGCNLKEGLCAQCYVDKKNKEAEEANKKQNQNGEQRELQFMPSLPSRSQGLGS